MDDALFGGAVPSFSNLRIQKNSLGAFGFGNGQDGLYGLKGTSAVAGTALDDAIFGTLLLPAKASPRSVDLWPIFHTGVPNLKPYQLATGKAGNPLATGKPFISNFLPNGGDMLRLNMAVPPTQRNDAKFSSLGLVQAAVLGLTDPAYNASTAIQNIPNMDGFPNGRRLEDDVTRIELQAVGGVVLAAIGLWYDDYVAGGSPVTPQLIKTLTYSTGVEKNDKPFKTSFPYVAAPFAGTDICPCDMNTTDNNAKPMLRSEVNMGKMMDLSAPELIATVSPNPFVDNSIIRYHLDEAAQVTISVYNAEGKVMKVLVNKRLNAGTYTQIWNGSDLTKGTYLIQVSKNGAVKQSIRAVKG